MESLGIETKLLLGQIVNFLILFLILGKFLYKPIVNLLNERREKIAESLKNAEQIKQDLTETSEKIKNMMNEAEEKAVKIMEDAKMEAKKEREAMLLLAKDQAEKEIEKAKIAIETEKERASKDLEKHLVGLIGMATEKILKNTVSADMQQQALQEALVEVGNGEGKKK